MKILTAAQIRQADQITLQRQGIPSFELMQRAATVCAAKIRSLYPPSHPVIVVCGSGNNGGDGYCIAADLYKNGYKVTVHELDEANSLTPDCQMARSLVQELKGLEMISGMTGFSPKSGTVIIDALYGTGINRPVTGITAEAIQLVNQSGCPVVSVDLPSGMPADPVDDITSYPIVKASYTLTFHCPKLSLLMPGSGVFTGEMHVLDIGLDKRFTDELPDRYTFLDEGVIGSMLKSRQKFSHKGDFGHALLIAGSKGKIGAAILAAKACLRSGAGLLTVHIPECGYTAVHTAVPEAMVSIDKDEEVITVLPELHRFAAIGMGPGLGTEPETKEVIKKLLTKITDLTSVTEKSNSQPKLVLDADALNILSEEQEVLKLLPAGSILTPHPGEFRRLAGRWSGDKEMLDQAERFAKETGSIVVLKGHRTIITNGTRTWINSTGNSGMAKGGSGDVLTGLITGLAASGYGPTEAAILGVFWHGKAGDRAAAEFGEASMTAGDIAQYIRVEH